MVAIPSIPFQTLAIYSGLLNKARSHGAQVCNWRLATAHLKYSAKLDQLLGIPVKYTDTTNVSHVILETDRGDFAEIIGWED
jgi:hypothetical protein